MEHFSDYAHLYLGCEGLLPNDDGEMKCRVRLNYPILSGNHWSVRQFKPILRPLESITKEEVADLMGISGFIKQGNFMSPFFQLEYEDLENKLQYNHLYIHQLSPPQVVFLLRKHFDLFYFIKNGEAISSTN